VEQVEVLMVGHQKVVLVVEQEVIVLHFQVEQKLH
jgi:hypothetical protein